MASINCGACKGTHETVDQVRACYGVPEKVNVTKGNLDNRVITVTCLLKSCSQKWETTKREAIAHRGKCPKCRPQVIEDQALEELLHEDKAYREIGEHLVDQEEIRMAESNAIYDPTGDAPIEGEVF